MIASFAPTANRIHPVGAQLRWANGASRNTIRAASCAPKEVPLGCAPTNTNSPQPLPFPVGAQLRWANGLRTTKQRVKQEARRWM